MIRLKKRYVFFYILACGLLTACGTLQEKKDGLPPGFRGVDVSHIHDAVVKNEPHRPYNMRPYTVHGKRYTILKTAKHYQDRGIASWYGFKFHDRKTASGEPYNMFRMTGAHRTLPIPSYVRVMNLKNGKQVVVRINDRGPFHNNRIIDLSYVAAKKLGITQTGTGLVEVMGLTPDTLKTPPHWHRGFTHLYLQMGAFSDSKRAEALAKRLHGFAGLPAHTRKTEPAAWRDARQNNVAIQSSRTAAWRAQRGNPVLKETQTLYKVLLGPIPSVQQTDALKKKIERAGFGEAITYLEH